MAQIDFDLRMADGRDINAFHQILEARRAELGETTKNSCVAVTINILKSLRTETKVARTSDRANISVRCLDDQYYPSWKTSGGKRLSCIRAGMNGAVIQVKGIAWISPYRKGIQLHTYEVKDNVAADKVVKAIVVAASEDEAVKWMQRKHKNRIKHRRGLAKLALGMAMHEVSSEQSVQDDVETQVKKFATANAEASVVENGFNSGDVSIHVRDKLNYAMDALKSGQQSIDNAVRSSLNKMAAYIIHRLHQKGLDTNMKIPYPELKRT